jgi:glycosyltransferase involved in cell wall biosynthesis
VLRLPFNLGVGGALRCGFRWAVRNGFEAVVQCDADGQHSPHLISALEAKAEGGGFDLVIGSRFLEVSEYVPSLIRRMPMVVMANLASRAGGIRLTDTTSGFRLIREPLLSQMALQFPVHYLGDTFDATVAAARRGYRIAEVSVSMRQRNTGKASSGTAKSVLFILRSLTTYVLGGGLRYNSRPIEGG